MAFKDADEVRRYIGGVFQAGFDDPEVGPKMTATGIVVKFEFTEPEADLTEEPPVSVAASSTGSVWRMTRRSTISRCRIARCHATAASAAAMSASGTSCQPSP